MMRRAQAKTPPKPDSEIAAKAKNSSAMLGAGVVAAGTFACCGAGGETEDLPGNALKSFNLQRFSPPTGPARADPWSFFDNHLRLYSWVPAQAGYGDKWPS
jgi:hypothetical protein